MAQWLAGMQPHWPSAALMLNVIAAELASAVLCCPACVNCNIIKHLPVSRLLAFLQASAQPKDLGPAPAGQQQQPGSAAVLGKAQPFSSFFKHIRVQLDEAQYPGDDGLFVWEKALHR
jgi:hypothetical protein